MSKCSLINILLYSACKWRLVDNPLFHVGKSFVSTWVTLQFFVGGQWVVGENLAEKVEDGGGLPSGYD